MTKPLPALAQAFAQQCATWARAQGAAAPVVEALHTAAGAISAAAAEGHVCLALDELPAHCTRAALLASGVVGEAAGESKPLVLDDEGRLYLARQYDQERRLAQSLGRLAALSLPPPGQVALAALRSLFPAEGPKGQQLAATQALSSALCIISGGPGTGKTTTVANLLACLLADQPDLRIALAAPTGKAAARLMESLGSRAAHLPPAVVARLPREAATAHRLLGIHPHSPQPLHHPGNPLPYDVVVVDEASMLDLSLATRLVAAVPTGARLILLGDKEQLSAVEAGAVFSEISADPSLSPALAAQLTAWTGAAIPEARVAAAPRPLRDCVAWLQESYRFGRHSPLGQLAQALVDGEIGAAFALLNGDQADLQWSNAPGEALTTQEQAGLVGAWQPYVSAVQSGEPAGVFAALDQFRVLCARRGGLRGVEATNNALEKALRPGLSGDGGLPKGPHYRGRPVLITRNDSPTQLFNGDIGVLLPHEAGLAACFPDGRGGYRWLPLARLPAHETAFALTIHKSQGSEFDRVCILLPSDDSPLLTRELIYTAVTRARQGIQLHAPVDTLEACIQRRTRRYNGLASRLQEQRVG